MLREIGPETAGLRPRTAARLIRLASERAADDTLEQNAIGDDRLPGNDADTNAGRGPRAALAPGELSCLVASFRRRDSPVPIRASAHSRRTATLAQRGHLARGPARSIRRHHSN